MGFVWIREQEKQTVPLALWKSCYYEQVQPASDWTRMVDSVHLFWDCVPHSLCSKSFQDALPEDSELLSEARWLCQHMVTEDRKCGHHLTAGSLLFTRNDSKTAIVVPLGEETPSPVPSKMYFSSLQTAGSKFSTFSGNFLFQCF